MILKEKLDKLFPYIKFEFWDFLVLQLLIYKDYEFYIKSGNFQLEEFSKSRYLCDSKNNEYCFWFKKERFLKGWRR